MTNMAAMPIYGKNLKKSSSPEPINWWPWNLVCSIVYGPSTCTTKAIQIMTLGWPWPILCQGQIWSDRLLYGKSENYLFFGNYCSLGSQSNLKHSAKWVNEAEWVSKVKVIIWPWSKVTQISKLKLVFPQNSWAIWNQSSCESFRENRNENLYKWGGSHDQHGRQGWSTRTCTRTYLSTIFAVLSCTRYLAKFKSTCTRTYLSTEAKT